MLDEKEKASIENFYGHHIEEMANKSIRKFLADKSIGCVKLGNERGFLDIEAQLANFDISSATFISVYKINNLSKAIEIKRPNSSAVPISVSESFERHVWYSRYCLTDIRLVKFKVSIHETFALYVEGYVDDSWDNGIEGWEIYESNGNFIGSLMKWNDEWLFKERMITHEDFPGSVSPPMYTPELVAQSSSPIEIAQYPGFALQIWSEQDVTIIE